MMSRSLNTGRTALAVVAASSLLLLAACGDDPKPAAGSDSGSDSGSENKTIVFSPLGLQIPAMKQLSEGVQHYGEEKGYEVITLSDCVAATSPEEHANAIRFDYPMFSEVRTSQALADELQGAPVASG